MDKKGRLSSTLLMIVILLPLIGLLIMDNEMKDANVGPTGMFIKDISPTSFSVAIAVLAGIILLVFGAVELKAYKKNRKIKTRSLEEINNDINALQKNLEELSK